MQKIGLLLITLPVVSVAACSSFPGAPTSSSTSSKEHSECPWAPTTHSYLKNPMPVVPLIPSLQKNLKSDLKNPGALKLWGKSLNYDELAKAEIVPPGILDELLKDSGAPARRERVVHAGVEHIYGYLLSVIKTPYGYKCERWVSGELEAGLGLKAPLFTPEAPAGTALQNVTAVFSKIAFRDDPAFLKRSLRKLKAAHEALAFTPSPAKMRRLVEKVRLSPTRTVELRTDFIEFTHPQKNAQLLIYSVRDSAEKHAQLITGFPVKADFAKGLFDPAKLGQDKPIQTRYNAYVEGWTGKGKELTGERKEWLQP